MGNRAVITTVGATDNTTGIYVHWNGGVNSVEAFCAYCDMKGFRSPDMDCYGWAYLATVIGNFFGDGLSLGVDRIGNLDTDNGDNGVYYIKDWKIVARSKDYPQQLETDKSKLYEFLLVINKCQSPNIKVRKTVIKRYCKKNNIPMPEEKKNAD